MKRIALYSLPPLNWYRVKWANIFQDSITQKYFPPWDLLHPDKLQVASINRNHSPCNQTSSKHGHFHSNHCWAHGHHHSTPGANCCGPSCRCSPTSRCCYSGLCQRAPDAGCHWPNRLLDKTRVNYFWARVQSTRWQGTYRWLCHDPWPNRHLCQSIPPLHHNDGLEPRHQADHLVCQQRRTSSWHHQELWPNWQGHS